jgi:hypothetical protein
VKTDNSLELTLKIEKLEELVEQLSQELALLRNEFELVKNEGCWLSKNNSDHLHGEKKYE